MCESPSRAPKRSSMPRCRPRSPRARSPYAETTVKVEIGLAFLAGDKGRALGEKAQGIYREIDRELGLTLMTGGGTDAAYAARSGKATVVESFGLAASATTRRTSISRSIPSCRVSIW